MPNASWPSHRGAALLIAFRLLVALLPGQDLLLCAKHLFVAAGTVWQRLAVIRRLQASTPGMGHQGRSAKASFALR
jgi:hypothetical protein